MVTSFFDERMICVEAGGCVTDASGYDKMTIDI